MSASVLPARAGMSPEGNKIMAKLTSAPRTGGDEPTPIPIVPKFPECSPHGRG